VSKISPGEVVVGFVWLAIYCVIILTGLLRDAGPLLTAMDRSGVF
jgi:hypothetical protein